VQIRHKKEARVKRFIVYGSLIIPLVAGTAWAQDETPMLDRGTRELSISGQIEVPDLDEIDYDLDFSYGYFFRDGWEAGFRVAAADFGGLDRLAVAGFTEFNFNRGGKWVPFIGGGLGLISADFGDNISLQSELDDDGLVFNVEGGGKYFVRSYMAISLSIDFQVATEDLFATGDAIEDNLSSINVGMRYYF
jgi:hypothetical protein